MTESGARGTVEPIDAAGTIAALRERGAHGCDPVRFRFIEALARRTPAHDGEARRLLDGKLAQALSAYAAQFEQARVEAGRTLDAVAGRFPEAADELRQFYAAGDFSGLRVRATDLEGQRHRAPLTDLVRHVALRASEIGDGSTARDAEGHAGTSTELKTLRYFRSTWSRLGVDQRLNQSLAKVPENAGPLNSHVLALRSLHLMRDLSPDYLKRFMSYLDALLWLEQVNDRGAGVSREVARGDGDRKQKAGRRRSV